MPRKSAFIADALCNRGLARPDPTGMGLLAGENGCLIGPRVPNLQRVFTLGPVLKGQLWETTAVRELRQQAADLAAPRRPEGLSPTSEAPAFLNGSHWHAPLASNERSHSTASLRDIV